MDQDTSNSPGKARWRERLGMGSSGKDLPKISDEFKPAPPPPRPATPKETRLPPAAIHGHQPVTRPAPMAPRTPIPRNAPAQAGGSRPVSPIPQGASGLGDRLRAERQAAERLAEQRVAQARGKSTERPLQPPTNQNIQKPAQPEKPKFTFSPEELAKDKREQAAPPPEREFPSFSGKSGMGATPPPPLTPPRPALGGNVAAQPQQQRQPPQQPPKPQPAPKPQASTPPAGTALPPAGAAFQPRYSGPPQPAGGNYRSLDPPPGGLTPRPRPYADTAGYREDPLARREDPLARRPVNREYESYRRGPALPPQPAYGDESNGPSLGDYRRRPPVPARMRQPAYDEDVNEVFEDEEPQRPQRRRASAQDYNRAYRDDYEGYDTETPRRRGPWPWLAAFAVIALLAGGIIYYYLAYYKQPGAANGNVPVIEAPQQAPKTAPENSSGSTLGTQGAAQPNAADQRKQIYDRILGDDEVGGGQIVPTQEQPQVIEPTGNNEGQGAAPLPGPGTGTQDNSNEQLPLPLPPPGANDQQGSLPSNASQQTAALGAGNKTAAPQPVPEPVSTNTSDTGAPVPGQLAKASEQIASAPPPEVPQIEQVVSEPEQLPAQTKPKLKAEKKPEKKPPKQVAAAEDPGAGQDGAFEPLVLVPPAQPETTQAQIIEPDVAQPKAETAATEQKSKSFFNFGSGKRKLGGRAAENAQGQGATGNWTNAPDPNSATAEPAQEPQQQQLPQQQPPQPEPQQIAAVNPAPIPAPQPVEAAPQPQQAKPSGGGYVAQLASFRSEAEALAEYDRLRAKHGGVLNGLNPRIVKANVAGTSRYRLGVGPLATRSAASKVCNSLIAAGERDCLVRGN